MVGRPQLGFRDFWLSVVFSRGISMLARFIYGQILDGRASIFFSGSLCAAKNRCDSSNRFR